MLRSLGDPGALKVCVGQGGSMNVARILTNTTVVFKIRLDSLGDADTNGPGARQCHETTAPFDTFLTGAVVVYDLPVPVHLAMGGLTLPPTGWTMTFSKFSNRPEATRFPPRYQQHPFWCPSNAMFLPYL